MWIFLIVIMNVGGPWPVSSRSCRANSVVLAMILALRGGGGLEFRSVCLPHGLLEELPFNIFFNICT
jgi:hypothetical protein